MKLKQLHHGDLNLWRIGRRIRKAEIGCVSHAPVSLRFRRSMPLVSLREELHLLRRCELTIRKHRLKRLQSLKSD